ncbi:MAG TPA: ABC transporter permease [Chitinophaga sp.]|uniref:ABC transporter permease n=1 Tax=Chitinophaga sp. TaxID=1869181 RepID=UPI002CE97FDB|nr:ABC transporter permease [Chitinophaga sp.]HVI44827.1 ABC transporter permease [Chitinophaga sp.]
MTPIIRCLRSESLKIKATPALWLALCTAALLPALNFLGAVFNAKDMIPPPGLNPWDLLLTRAWYHLGTLLLTLFAVLSTALLVQTEYKANTWKQVLVQPVPEWAVYTGKLITTLLLTLFCLACFAGFSLIAGLLAGIIKPELQFLHYTPSLFFILKAIVHSFVGLLGVLGMQYALALSFRNFVPPIGAGLAGFIVSIFLMGTKFKDFFPYTSPLLTASKLKSLSGRTLLLNEWMSIVFFGVAVIAGYFLFLRYAKKSGA